MIRVLAVGSCRIFRPLRAAHEAGLIELSNMDHGWWFAHTSAGGRQYVEVLAGLKDVPEALRPLTCETMIDPLPKDLSDPALLDVDIVVQEISATKLLSVGSTHLNQARVWGHVHDLGLDTSKVLFGDDSELPDEDVLKGLQAARSTYDSVVEDVREVGRLAQAPVLCVDHLYSVMENGTVAPDRRAITEWLRELSKVGEAGFWSTEEYISAVGATSLLDPTHWAQSHELPVGRAVVKALARISTHV